jgi:ATP-binding cassette subfamily B protein
MKLLYSYLKKHKLLLFIALVLAAVNICFSLSDSVITGKLMQDCGVGIAKYKGNEIGFIKSVAFWLGLSLGASMISRITKNFQDYFTNIVIQRTGAEMYTDGIKKSLDLPYEEFEDQRSGETLKQTHKSAKRLRKTNYTFYFVDFPNHCGLCFCYCLHLQN